jgi:hypothetical protein
VKEKYMESAEYVIRFDDVSKAEASQYAGELRDKLLATSPELSVEYERDADNTQDFGATLAVVLGTPAVIILAQGIKAWLASRPTAQITISRRTGDVVFTGLTSADAAKVDAAQIAAALRATD